MIDVNAVLFRAASECQSAEETRYYLNGVYVHPHPEKGSVLVATDGHRLIVAHDETGKCEKPSIVFVEKKALADVKRSGNGKDARLVVDKDGHAIVGTYRSIKSAIVDGTYPDYAHVVKLTLAKAKENVFGPATFNQAYLSSFGRVAQLLRASNDKSVPVRVISYSQNDAALILFSDQNVFGILMPMRSIEQTGIPAFMQPILDPPKASARRKAVAKKPVRKASAKIVKRKAA